MQKAVARDSEQDEIATRVALTKQAKQDQINTASTTWTK